MKIGVAITSYNRTELLEETYAKWKALMPKGSVLIVVKDVFGIANAKNLCLKLLEDEGVTDFFLSDDDCWPISQDWWAPYVFSNEPHLMYQFKIPSRGPSDMKESYRDDKIVSYSHTRGAMLYVKKVVLQTVGGMDRAYGQAYYEHTDWTNRIHNAGLTSHRAMDVPGSDQLFYCLDQDGGVTSSIPDKVKLSSRSGNFARYQKSKTSKQFKEYR